MIEQDIVIASWIIFIVYWGVSSLFVKKSAIKRNWWVWKVRWLFLFVFVMTVLYNMKSGASTKLASPFQMVIFQNTPALGVIGISLLVIGLVGAIWARTVLGRNWSGYVTYKENHELVTSGPYSLVRHPIYSSLILMVIGSLIATGAYFLLGMLILESVIFTWRIGKEERIMIKLFGNKYREYMKKTKKLIPFVW